MAVLCLGLLIGEGLSGRFEASASDIYQQLEVLTEALGIVEEEYVDPLTTEELIEGALKGMLGELDQYSQYLTAPEYRDVSDSTRGHFGGLGIVIGKDENDLLTVLSPIAGTPAAEAGILPGDKIIGIDGVSTAGMSLHEAVELLRGEVDTKVTILIVRLPEDPTDDAGPEEIEVTITRARIQIPSLKAEMLPEHMGYVRITEFKESTARDLKKALKDLQKAELAGLVIDLRNNPGGLLQSAAEVSDMFLPRGDLIVRTESRDASQNMRFEAKREPQIPADVPLVVLLNRGSASASEIVAGALKDTGRAAVMGEQSFGKGSVQSIIPLKNAGALRLTTAKYLTPSGVSISDIGIQPDIEVKGSIELLRQLLRQGQRVEAPALLKEPDALAQETEPVADVQLEQAIEFLRQYDRSKGVEANLQILRERGLIVAAVPDKGGEAPAEN